MKKAIFILMLLVATVNSYSQVNAQTNYAGYDYAGVTPDSLLPNGVKHLGGGLIGDINADPVYGISQVQKGKMRMLWLETSTGRDATGITGWRVLDFLTFSMLGRTRYVFFTGDPAITCRRKGKEIANLVGEGRIIRSSRTFIPSNLWIADITKKKFERIPLTGVRCEYSEP